MFGALAADDDHGLDLNAVSRLRVLMMQDSGDILVFASDPIRLSRLEA